VVIIIVINLLIIICIHILSVAPCVIICYLPFRNQLCRPMRKIVAEAGAAVLVLVLFSALLYEFFNLNVESYLNLLFMLVGFLYYRKTINEGLWKLLFMFSIVFHLATVNSGIIHLVIFTFEEITYINWLIYNVAVQSIFYPLVWLICYKFLFPYLRHIESRDMKNLWVFPLFFTVIIFYFGIEHNHTKIMNPYFPVIFTLFSIISFFVYGILLRILSGVSQNAKLRENTALAQQQLEMLQSHIADTKKAQHDLRHHMSVIKSYAASNENEKLDEYLAEYIESIPDDAEFAYCDNFAVNSILRYHIGMARREGILIDTRLELPKNTGINDTDLCVIIGNCLENAIEACRKVSGEKFIKIHSKLSGKLLAITIDNSFDGILKKADDVLLSTKHEGEGIGTSSVKAIAKKYHGSAQFEVKDNVFQASVMLRIPS
jgi:signal transduction histidine kinase